MKIVLSGETPKEIKRYEFDIKTECNRTKTQNERRMQVRETDEENIKNVWANKRKKLLFDSF